VGVVGPSLFMLGDGTVNVRSLYVRAVRGLRGLLRRIGVLAAMEGSSRPFIRHLRSLFAIYDAADLASLGLPWWTYEASRQVEAFLASREAPRAFEFGSGASTLWLAERVAHLDSVEHDVPFAAEVTRLLGAADNVALHVVPARQLAGAPGIGSGRRGHEDLDFTDYIGTIDRVGGRFDLIVVDGRARVACLERARAYLAADGLIVFDDVRRKRYAPALSMPGLHTEVLAGAKPTVPYRDSTALLRPVGG
jgi:predicted O-methyltransferase YrrM